MWDYMIDLKKKFVPKKEKIYSLSREERRSKREIYKEGVYLTIKVTIDYTSIFCRKERQKEENGIRLSIS